jgi:2-alkyl-3-oxoalkanoate reductase
VLNDRLRVAIVGGGFISSSRHLPAYKKISDKVDMVGLTDLNLDVAKALSSKFGIRKAYANAAEMIVAEKPHLVDICTPPQTHASLAKLAIDSGCHVLIEKPMALTVPECDTIVAAAKSAGVHVCVAHTGLFYEPFVRARTIMEKGQIGRFAGMRVTISTPTDYMTSKREHWAHSLPGGAVGETGPHAVYMSLAFIRRVRIVSVEGVKLLPEYPWSKYEDYRINLVGDEGISSIFINYATNQWMVAVEITGSKGSLHLDLHGRCVLTSNRSRLEQAAVGFSLLGQAAQIGREAARTILNLLTRRTMSTHERLIRRLVETLRKGLDPPVTSEEGREAVRVMNTIAQQLLEARTGQTA